MEQDALSFDERIEVQRRKSKLKSKVSNYATVILFFGPYLFFFIVFFLYPVIQGVIDSFFFWNFGDTEKTFVGWQNYANILTYNPDFALANQWFTDGLQHTLLFVVLTVPFLIVIPLIIAILLNKKPWGEGFFRALFFLPNVLSVSTVCLIFKYFFNPNMGFIKSVPYESETWAAWLVLVVTTIWWTVGNNMVIMNAGLKQADQSLYEAAAVDGCGPIKSIWYITIPQISNQLVLCTITTTIASFNVYGQAEIITGGGPLDSTVTFIQRVMDFITNPYQNTGGAGVATAMCIIFALILIALSLIQLWLTREKKDNHRRIFKKSHAYEKGAS